MKSERAIKLISGGKDSIATYFKLRELGVPKSKIEFWHHDIDGGNPERHMDWRCTQSYMKALADAEGIPLRLSWRKGGFFGELYRIGASKPIEWVDPETGEIMSAKETPQQAACRKRNMMKRRWASRWTTNATLKRTLREQSRVYTRATKKQYIV